jgi:thymidine phosphorylase
MSAILTDMDQPLGVAIGHAIEVQEALDCLSGGGPPSLREITIELVSEMGSLVGLGSPDELRVRCERVLDDGRALERFGAMVRAQGGTLPSAGLELSPVICSLEAERGAWLEGSDAAAIGIALSEIGGARVQKEDLLDLSAGVEMLIRIGDRVEPGQEIARIRARERNGAELCRDRIARALKWSESVVAARPLIVERELY